MKFLDKTSKQTVLIGKKSVVAVAVLCIGDKVVSK